MTGCETMKKALYGKDPCDPSKARKMERVKGKPEKNLFY